MAGNLLTCGCYTNEHGRSYCGEHSPNGVAQNTTITNTLPLLRRFESGATRDIDTTKNDYEGFLSPLVIERFGEYMTKHRIQADGSQRESDNWQKGIPLSAYMKSGWRHFLQWWKLHRGYQIYPMGWSKWPDGAVREPEDMEEVLCAMLFNVQGYLHEVLKNKAGK